MKTDPAYALPELELAAALASRRTIESFRYDDADRIRVRAPSGMVLVDLEVTAQGVRLCCHALDLELRAQRQIEMKAKRLRMQAEQAVEIEGASIEIQASEAAARVRARGAIALDGEHVGLNSDPWPTPFSWTELARRLGGTGE